MCIFTQNWVGILKIDLIMLISVYRVRKRMFREKRIKGFFPLTDFIFYIQETYCTSSDLTIDLSLWRNKSLTIIINIKLKIDIFNPSHLFRLKILLGRRLAPFCFLHHKRLPSIPDGKSTTGTITNDTLWRGAINFQLPQAVM